MTASVTTSRVPGARRTRTCSTTGLRLAATTGQTITRIQKVSYGPMNPWFRDLGATPEERHSWGRYDVAGHRTIYGGAPVAAAYAECLGYMRIDAGLNVKLSDLFDDTDYTGDPGSVLDTITSEWDSICHMPPKRVVKGWREARGEYLLSLPASGWVIDIEHPQSIAAIRTALWSELGALDVPQLTTEDLRGKRRVVTTTIAEWIHAQVLDDGSLPHGIKFGSKHGSGWDCWCVWLRALDDGKPVTSEPTRMINESEIRLPGQNPPLHAVAELFGLKIF